MKKILIGILLVLFSLSANELKVGDSLGTFSILNQHDEKVTVDKNVQKILISFEKGTGADINEYLSSKDTNFLQKHHTVFIANISGMPSIITKMFALPKMRKYKHEILLIYDDEDDRFKAKEDYSTLYTLQDGIIKSITYFTKEDLKSIFNEN